MQVLQDWTNDLPLMQQSVLLSAVRGPDGVHKNHVVKYLLKWYRRCILHSAFDRKAFITPYEIGGGNFTGPSISEKELSITGDWQSPMTGLLKKVIESTDELPFHFVLHLVYACEVVGYKHPYPNISAWWNEAYILFCYSFHMTPETKEQMDYRLSDVESQYRSTRAHDID